GYALVAVAVSDVHLVGLRIIEQLGDLPETIGRVAVGRREIRPDAQQELSFFGELQHHAVVAAVAADPHVAGVIDGDAVVRGGPLVVLVLDPLDAAPVTTEVALLVELEDWRRLGAAHRGLVVERLLVRRERIRAVDDPDVILRVDRHADRLTLIPVIRKRFRERRIDFKARHLHAAGLGLSRRRFLHQTLADTQSDEGGDERGANQKVTFSVHTVPPGRPEDVPYLLKLLNSAAPGPCLY